MARRKKQTKKSRLTPEQQRQRNEANKEAAIKAYRFIKHYTKAYYKWAGNLPKGKGRRTLGRVAPALLLFILIPAGGGEPTEPTQTNKHATSAVVEPVRAEAETSLIDTNLPSYPVTIVRTGLDFEYTYEGTLRAYADKTVVEATWRSECFAPAQLNETTNEYTYTILTDSSTLEAENNFTDCLAGEKGVLSDTYPVEIDSDGTIRADAIEADGTIIVKDSIVITGGPAPKQVSKISQGIEQDSEPVTEQDEPTTEQYEPEPQVEDVEVYVAPAPQPVRHSTCKEYKAAGLGPFTVDDPQYEAKLDRDKDGLACE